MYINTTAKSSLHNPIDVFYSQVDKSCKYYKSYQTLLSHYFNFHFIFILDISFQFVRPTNITYEDSSP